MEYIKKEELIKGEIYNATISNDGSEYIFKPTENFYNCININKKYGNHLYRNGNFCSDIFKFSQATSEEKHWLETCIKLDKFITFEEAMKTFIPEYYEYIHKEDSSWKIGKIYKVNNDGSFNFESGRVCEYGNYYKNSNYFKPSTKEAYDAQFVVKEPEFVLPERWCLKITKENLDFCKSLENNELHYKKNYNYCVNGYYSAIRSDSGNYGFSGIPKDFTEITFEQFKKYVLKEETVEEKVIEPLPQFKVIETIETITKVENNEGSQFFIGDTVIDSKTKIKSKIISFKYNVDKTAILAITDKTPNIGIGINHLEHYIEPKVEVEETLLEKAKRLYPIGTIVKSVSFNDVGAIRTDIFKERNHTCFGKIIYADNGGISIYSEQKDKWAEIINE